MTPRAAEKARTAPRKRTPSTRSGPRGRRGTKTPRILVVRAAGTNCDRETAFAFGQAGADAVTVHANELLAKPGLLAGFHGLAIPGGFSHGDDLGAGTIFGARIRARLVDAIRRLVDRGGVVVGICNGFQVLVKTGLVPGFDGKTERVVTLASNEGHRYEDRWVTLEVTTDRCAFLRKGERYEVPVAHAEGRLLPRSDAVRKRLHADGQVALRYIDPTAAPGHEHPARYPFNPNGAVDDIAGITDPTGRILGLMPHPERNQFPWQSPRFHRDGPSALPDGLRLFRNAVSSLR